MKTKLRQRNAELLYRLLYAEQAGDKAGAASVRKELILANLKLVERQAQWFQSHWKGCDPTPTKDELISIGNWRLCKAAGRIAADSTEPTQYFRCAIRRGLQKYAFREHIMARLPIIIDSDGKERQTLMRQLEYGTHENNGEKEGGIAWEGYDGLIVPVPAGEPRSQRKPLASTSRRRSRRGLENPDGRVDAPADADRQLDETVEALLHICENDTERRVVELLVAKTKRRQIAKALGVSSPSTVQGYIKRIGARYKKYLDKIENP